MGNCACPIDNCAKKEDVLVNINPDFSNVFNIIPDNKNSVSITKKETLQSKFSTGDNKCSINTISKTSIKPKLITEMYQLYPSLYDTVDVKEVNINYPGVGEFSGEINEITNERHGRGIQNYPDKSIYLSYWKNDKPNGKGKMIYPKGDYYEGDFVEGRIEGFGAYTSISNGPSYVGQWKNDLYDGYGTEKWPDHLEYKGEYREGKKWGSGTLIFQDGSVYTGTFFADQMHGKGKYVWKNKNEYEGEWRYNKMEGNGTFLFSDSRKYVGKYVNDKKEGFGVFTWPNGKIYKGQWKQGKQHGEGRMFCPSEKIWKNGE